MKTIRPILVGVVVLLLAGYAMFTTMEVHRLENQIAQLQDVQIVVPPVVYSISESFSEYFGPDGMKELERRLKRQGNVVESIINDRRTWID